MKLPLTKAYEHLSFLIAACAFGLHTITGNWWFYIHTLIGL